MCGIIYVRRKDGKSAVKAVKKRYRKQKYRGMDGFGYVAVKDNTVVSYQRAATEKEIMQKLDAETAPEILFHHRYPTSTPNMEEQAHPIKVAHETLAHEYYVVHNGVIHNADTRKEAHVKLGFAYTTDLQPLWKTTNNKLYQSESDTRFNDSEALAIDMALALEGKVPNIASEGPASVIALQVKGGKVVDRVFYRNMLNPLKYENNATMTTLTSLGGADVPPGFVMRLITRGHEQHPSHLLASPTYSTTSHYTGYRMPNPYEHSLDTGYAHDDDLGIVFPDHEPPQELQHISQTPNYRDTIIAAMKEDVLWEEYDKCLSVESTLTDGIDALDAKVNAGIVSDEILSGRQRLQTKLDRMMSYKAKLDAEVNTRIHLKNLSPTTG